MFQQFGSCDASVFGDMPDEKNGSMRFFCETLEFCGTLPDLGNAAGCRIEIG